VASPLDNPAWHALNGPQRALGRVAAGGRAARYDPAISPFGAVGADADPASFAALAEPVDPGGTAALVRPDALDPPAEWTPTLTLELTQWVADALPAAPALDFVELGPDDRDAMLELALRTEPGPFERRTPELGRYIGVRRDGRLLAMAGERMRLPGWTEVSAVCTDPAARRQGLGAALTLHVAAGIRARGDEAFLHVIAGNDAAAGLYRALGFRPRAALRVTVLERGGGVGSGGGDRC